MINEQKKQIKREEFKFILVQISKENYSKNLSILLEKEGEKKINLKLVFESSRNYFFFEPIVYPKINKNNIDKNYFNYFFDEMNEKTGFNSEFIKRRN